MYSEIAANKRKTWAIMFVFMVLVGLLAVFFSVYFTGEVYVTFVVLAGALIYMAFSYFQGGKMALGLNGAEEVTDTSHRLYRTVENLSITVGLPTPKVYIINDQGLNAFATGRDPEHAMVAATSGLLDSLSDAELEGVMAHEMGHVQNYDIRVSMMAFALVAVIAILSDIIMRSLWFGGGNSRDNKNGGNALIFVGIIAAILAPIAAQLLRLAISRRREYLADSTGALTTRYPEGLASALEKIQAQGSTLRRQNTATAHLFISNPLSGKSISKMFATHPPVEDRIAKLRSMGSNL